MNFKDKKVAVLGMGVEGISTSKFLKKHGAKVTELDKNQGKDYLNDLNHFDLIVRSPGVKLSLLNKVSKEKITSQTKLFFEECPCPIIGVTGTKGKGTTASLIYEMLKKEGKDAYLGGNIGKPPLEFLDKLKPQSIVVLELSSFQLQDLTKSPHIAVMLMTTSEHLDWHKDTKEYVDAKRNILRFQNSSDFAIVNRDYPASNESDVFTQGKVYYVSRERDGYEGCFVRNGKVIIRIRNSGRLPTLQDDARQSFNNNQRSTRSLSESRLSGSGESKNKTVSAFNSLASGQPSIISTEIINVKDILLPGRHNLENACAACMAATLSGVSKESMISVLKSFKGLEHRLELVRELNGVKYYDDSFSTTPETAIAAIEAFKNPEILILGGSSKGSDFTQLGQVISNPKNNIKAIIGIGKEWKRIKAKIHNTSIMYIIEALGSMREIVQTASKIAKKGDVVLLSPACASFDMFKNYKYRGEQFKKEVKNL